MTDHIIDLSTAPARLSIHLDQLVIGRHELPDVTVPLAELAVLVVAHWQISLSNSVLSGIAANGGALIACDGKSMPVGIMLPIEQHHLQAERFEQQAQAPVPLKKRVWQQIIQAKVTTQGKLLTELGKEDRGLLMLAAKVRSGDPDNIEGQASRRYWPALFNDPDFRRDREAGDQNRFLNYGYAILRAMVSRAICASGLHPSLGVHHHNRYDAFCLADDLMEPFRPLVDRAVVGVLATHADDSPLDKEIKGMLISALITRLTFEDESRTLFDILARTAASLAKVFAGEAKKIALPEI